jgi:tetrahydromethanopterin S-methyltransferase subunit G
MRKWILHIALLLFCVDLFAQTDRSVPFTLEDRDRILRIEQRLETMEQRFQQIDKRFEQVDKRFEQVDKRFEELRADMNARFEQQHNTIMMLIGVFTAITAATIGFALWDRRTMIRPFETKVKEIETNMDTLKTSNKNLIESLRELAKTDTRLAEILKQFNLL